jgi:hypothetical protein
VRSKKADGAANDDCPWKRGGIAAFRFHRSPAAKAAVPTVSSCVTLRPGRTPFGWFDELVPL